MLRNRSAQVTVATCALLGSMFMSACGSEESTATAPSSTGSASATTPEDSTSEAGLPVPPGTADCAEVWQDGSRLPRTYQGCAEEAGYVERDVLLCSSGQKMVTYADLYYAVLGGEVHEASTPLDKDRDYTAAVRRCRA